MATGKYTNIARELFENLPSLTNPRTDFIALFIVSVLKVGTVNLSKISICMGGQANVQSNYRRIRRFIDQIRWCYHILVPLILKWSNVKGPLTLIIYRTNWKLGSSDLNILCISVLCEGFCVPESETLLPKKDNNC